MEIKNGALLETLNTLKAIESMIKPKCDVEFSIGRMLNQS